MKQEMMGWQWHQLDHMQMICSSLQTDNHASASSLNFTGRMLLLPPSQQCRSDGITTGICVLANHVPSVLSGVSGGSTKDEVVQRVIDVSALS